MGGVPSGLELMQQIMRDRDRRTTRAGPAVQGQIPVGGSREASLGQAFGQALGQFAGGRVQRGRAESEAEAIQERQEAEFNAFQAMVSQAPDDPILTTLAQNEPAFRAFVARPEGQEFIRDRIGEAVPATPAEEPQLQGPARDIADLMRAADTARAAGRDRAAELLTARAEKEAGMEEGSLQQNLDFLRRNTELQPGTPEFQQAAMQLAGLGGTSPTVVEGIDPDGQAVFAIVERNTGEVVPLEGVRPRPDREQLTAEMAERLAERGPQEPGETLIPDDIDVAAALGPGGFFRNAANVVTEMFGAGGLFKEGIPAAQTSAAREALNNLQVTTTIFLQEGVPGRPSIFLLERLEGLTVSAGSLFQGERRALDRFDATRRLISSEIDRMRNELRVNPDLTDKDIRDMARNMSSLEQLNTAYVSIIDHLESGRQQAPADDEPPPGVPPGAWANMTPEQRALFQQE